MKIESHVTDNIAVTKGPKFMTSRKSSEILIICWRSDGLLQQTIFHPTSYR